MSYEPTESSEDASVDRHVPKRMRKSFDKRRGPVAARNELRPEQLSEWPASPPPSSLRSVRHPNRTRVPRPPKRERAVRAEIIENTAARHGAAVCAARLSVVHAARSGSLKGTRDVLNRGCLRSRGPGHGHNVEAGRVIEQFMPPQIREGHARERRCLSRSTASDGCPASCEARVFTSTKTTVRPSTATISSSPSTARS